MPRTTKRNRHRRHGSDLSQSDPCTNIFINQVGSMIEYLDRSCTSAVENIRFPGDSTTVFGDMDTVELEQMEIDTIVDTVDMSASDIKPAHSYATDADISTAFSVGSRTSYSTQQSRISSSRSPKKKAPAGNVHLVGRLHAKVPETNTYGMQTKGTFDNNSIVTAPTQSFTSSKGGDGNMDHIGTHQNLQNAVIQEEEAASVSQRTASNTSSYHAPPSRMEASSPVAPKKSLTQAEQKNAAIMEGLDLCRRIRQSYHPETSPMHQRSSFQQESSASSDGQVNEPRQQSDAPPEVMDADVPKTKMYGEKASMAAQLQAQQQEENNNTARLPLPRTVPKQSLSQKFKAMVPLRTRKGSF